MQLDELDPVNTEEIFHDMAINVYLVHTEEW